MMESNSGAVTKFEVPPTLATAIRMAVVPIGADDAVAQRGKVASGWEIYYAAGHPVIWKSGERLYQPPNQVQKDC